ncbi:FRG domain-containing protein [Vreelandella titanicae]|uniref:FRG domain-containing protein n=1 Tax=Vreelandella titanicae TaxID=664683 RepID=UPI003FD713F2
MDSYKNCKSVKTARELYDLLLNSYKNSPQIVFRGHGSASYDLEPGIARHNEDVNKMYAHHPLILDGVNYRSYEFELLRNFIIACDKTGITIPNDGNSFRLSFNLADSRISVPFGVVFDEDSSKYFNPPSHWPDINSYSLMVMAQHHGVATRLLDWSGSPLTAMYFASVSGLNYLTRNGFKDIKERKMAIWALNGKLLNKELGRDTYALIKPPASLSVNMVPQEGYFTTSMLHSDDRDSYILNRFELDDEILIQYVIDVNQAIDMYEICKRHGYTGAKLYPGLDGAAKEANEAYMLKALKNNITLSP